MSPEPPEGNQEGTPPVPDVPGTSFGASPSGVPTSSQTEPSLRSGPFEASPPGATGPGGAGGPDGAGRPEGADGAESPSSQGARHRRRRRHRWIGEWAVIIVIALVAAFVVRTYVVETFYVPSTSMWPTLKAGDRIVVNKLYGTVHTGDIVVFKRPPAEDCGGPVVPDLVKRVVGLPGQTVSAKEGKVYITGKLLSEPWLPKGQQTYTTMSGSYTVPKGDYFVMGDNRVNSCDSRMWGPVKASYIVGKVFLILWPPGQFRFF